MDDDFESGDHTLDWNECKEKVSNAHQLEENIQEA